MSSHSILLPTKPKIIKDENTTGIFEIDGLYPGYGHTLGNSLRRVILSSIPGAAITSISIDGVKHEFSTIDGVKEDVIAIILNLKKVRFKLHSDEETQISLSVKGPKKVTSKDIQTPSQVEVVNKDQYLFEITEAKEISINLTVEKGLGYVPRELISKEKADIGAIILDAAFTPIRRVSYEVENMRVGDRTDHNRLRISIETDGSITAKEAFESSIQTMIHQLQSIVGYREFSTREESISVDTSAADSSNSEVATDETDITKMKIEDLSLSTRTVNTLIAAGVKTLGGLVRKSLSDVKDIEGMGDKGLTEIKELVANYGLTLKEE
jgi:DNA-directed RNA polymerase subunit alpha